MARKESTAPATSAPRAPRQKVHIQVIYLGNGPPGPILSEKCDRVEETLVEVNAGTIGNESRSGGGAVDIYVNTREPQNAITEAWKIVNHLGLSSRTTIKIATGKAEG